MSTKPSPPELRPNRYDALVVLVVLALAAALAVRPFLAARAPPGFGRWLALGHGAIISPIDAFV